MIPPPIQAIFKTDDLGRLISPAWLSWFLKLATLDDVQANSDDVINTQSSITSATTEVDIGITDPIGFFDSPSVATSKPEDLYDNWALYFDSKLDSSSFNNNLDQEILVWMSF
jgi:hypothetical protein